MFLISLNYKCQLEEVDRYVDDHAAFLKKEYQNGSFILSGRKIPRTGGIILSNLKSKDELELVLSKDPFNQAGIAEYSITEFAPSMAADGFEVLTQ